MRAAALLAALLFVSAASAEIPVPVDGAWRDVAVSSAPYQLRGDAGPEEGIAVDALLYRGGVHLTSDDPAFGGLSGLMVSEDGSQLVAISDRGQWLESAIDYDASGRLAGLSQARMAAVTDKDGVVLAGPIADAEGLAATTDGRFFVSFEREHRVDIYRKSESGLYVFDAPFVAFPDHEGAPPNNKGLEAVAVLDDGVLVIAEGAFPNGATGFVIGADGERRRFMHTSEAGFAVTDAARLGDRLFLLERAYSRLIGVRARIHGGVVPPADDPRYDATLLARLGGVTVVDNMEGLAVRTGADGETLLYVLSDDNHSDRQKTILLMFEIAD